jgi:hypothetical protein
MGITYLLPMIANVGNQDFQDRHELKIIWKNHLGNRVDVASDPRIVCC